MARLLKNLLLFLFLGLPVHGVEAPATTWGSETVADKLAWGDPSSYGYWGNMVLTEGRYPFIVYLDRSAAPCLRGVWWENGNRRDELMFPVNAATDSVKVVANGSHVAVAWSVNDGYPYRKVMCSVRSSTGWTPAETAYSGQLSGWSLALTSNGEPIVATGTVTSFYVTQINLLKRQNGQWIVEPVISQNRSFSDVAVVISSGDEVTVAWRAYEIGGGQADVYYSRKTNNVWYPRATGATILNSLFIGPAGQPCMIASTTGGALFYLPLLADGSGTSEAFDGGDLPATSATSAPDGTVYVVGGSRLSSRRDGIWSSRTGPLSHAVLAATDGAVHLLGTGEKTLCYQTLLPQTWSEPEPLTSYEEGSTMLDSLALDPTGDPRIFAWLNGELEFSAREGSWHSNPVDTGVWGGCHVYDNQGVLHVFHGDSYYGTLNHEGEMEWSPLPVSISTSSSSSIFSMVLDAARRPHVGFYTGIGTSSAQIKYGVKTGDVWTIETVSAADYSDQHCALVLDAAGTPWMFNSQGLFRRGAGVWVREYSATGCMWPGLGISRDGTVNAVFYRANGVYALTGKPGAFAVTLLDYQSTTPLCGFAMAGDRPIAVYRRQLDYYYHREVLVMAEKVGNRWRQRFITSVADGKEFESPIKVAVDDRGHVTMAALRRELRGHQYHMTLFACRTGISDPDPATLSLGQTVTSGGRHRFSMNLDEAPYWRDITLQASPDLGDWTPLFRIGPDFTRFPGVKDLSVRGDAFRTGLTFDAPADAARYFMRMTVEVP